MLPESYMSRLDYQNKVWSTVQLILSNNKKRPSFKVTNHSLDAGLSEIAGITMKLA